MVFRPHYDPPKKSVPHRVELEKLLLRGARPSRFNYLHDLVELRFLPFPCDMKRPVPYSVVTRYFALYESGAMWCSMRLDDAQFIEHASYGLYQRFSRGKKTSVF